MKKLDKSPNSNYLILVIFAIAILSVIYFFGHGTSENSISQNSKIHDLSAVSTDQIFAGYIKMPTGSSLDWESFRLSTKETGFNWHDIVAFQEVDDHVLFLIAENVNAQDHLKAKQSSPVQFTSTARFLMGVMHHSRSRQHIIECSRFEPLTFQENWAKSKFISKP